MLVRICRLNSVILIGLGVMGLITHGPVLGFGHNPIHQILLVVSGAAILWVGCANELFARTVCLAGAAGFGLMALSGFKDVGVIVDLFDLRGADNWLYLGLASLSLAAAIAPQIVTACTNRWHKTQAAAMELKPQS